MLLVLPGLKAVQGAKVLLQLLPLLLMPPGFRSSGCAHGPRVIAGGAEFATYLRSDAQSLDMLGGLLPIDHRPFSR